MKNTVTLALMLLGALALSAAGYNDYDNILSGRNIMDVNLKSYAMALDQVEKLPSLKDAGSLGVYIIRTSEGRDVIHHERRETWSQLTTTDRVGGDLGMRGNSAITLEDLLVHKLHRSGFNVVETTGNYQENWSWDKNFIKEFGDRMEIDTLLLGSEMGGHLERYKYHTMFVDHYYIMAKHKVQLRTVSTHTGLVKSTDVFEGAARIKTARRFNVRGWDWTVLGVVGFVCTGCDKKQEVACLSVGLGMPLIESMFDAWF